MNNKFHTSKVRNLTRSIVWFLRSRLYVNENTLFKCDKDLALFCGVTPAQFSRISSGVCTPSAPTFLALLDLAITNGYVLNLD